MNHLAAHVDTPDLTEDSGQGTGYSSGPTADFEHLHLLRIFTLTDVDHVGDDFFVHGALTGPEKLVVAPVFALGIHEIAGVLLGTLIPIRPHLLQLLL